LAGNWISKIVEHLQKLTYPALKRFTLKGQEAQLGLSGPSFNWKQKKKHNFRLKIKIASNSKFKDFSWIKNTVNVNICVKLGCSIFSYSTIKLYSYVLFLIRLYCTYERLYCGKIQTQYFVYCVVFISGNLLCMYDPVSGLQVSVISVLAPFFSLYSLQPAIQNRPVSSTVLPSLLVKLQRKYWIMFAAPNV